MIAGLVASLGIPLLSRVLGGALDRVDHPVAKTAGAALKRVGEAAVAGDLTPEHLAAANAHAAEILEIEARRDVALAAEINRTMRAEIASTDSFARRWRPTFGYAVAFAWVLQMAGATWIIVAEPVHAADVLGALAGLSVMWGVALSVLGVNVVKRSHDKLADRGGMPHGLLDRLLGRSTETR